MLFITVKFNFQGVSGEFLSLSDLQSCPQQESHLVCWLVAKDGSGTADGWGLQIQRACFLQTGVPSRENSNPFPIIATAWMNEQQQVRGQCGLQSPHAGFSRFGQLFLLSTEHK